MEKYDINDLIEKENKGIIFGKISKSSKKVSGKGGYLPYEKGSIVRETELTGLTVEPLSIALGFCHYGDQLTIVSFTELAQKERVDDFLAFDNSGNKGCIQVPLLYVKDVLSLNDKSTIDLLRSHMTDEDFMATANRAKSHLIDFGCEEGASYIEELYKEIKNKNKPVEKEEPNNKETSRSFFSRLFKRKTY